VFLLLVLAPSREPGPSGPSEAVFPLPERFEGSYKNDWGETRVQGKHEGTDVFAPEGTPIRSITDGTVAGLAARTRMGGTLLAATQFWWKPPSTPGP
jgi:murein DD-endopeptidase MepM/ murein hydrolase activator NlpD